MKRRRRRGSGSQKTALPASRARSALVIPQRQPREQARRALAITNGTTARAPTIAAAAVGPAPLIPPAPAPKANNAPMPASAAAAAGPSIGQVAACGALFGAGSVLGILGAVDELEFHLVAKLHALGCAVTSFALGMLLSLWLLRSSRSRAVERAVPQRDAASIAAGLAFLVLALAWLALTGLAAATENWRGVLVQRFDYPAWLTLPLVCAPLCVMLMAVGALTAPAIAAARRWRSADSQHWRAGVGTGLLAGACAAGSSTPVGLFAPLALFLAAAIVVLPQGSRRATPPAAHGRSSRKPAGGAMAWGAVALLGVALLATWAPVVESESQPGTSLVRGLVSCDGAVDVLVVSATTRANLVRVDLPEPAELLLVRATPSNAEGDARVPKRFLRRLASRVTAGGHLVFMEPIDPALWKALRRNAVRFLPADWSGYRLMLQQGEQAESALVFGRDVRAWLTQLPPGAECEMELGPLPEPLEGRPIVR